MADSSVPGTNPMRAIGLSLAHLDLGQARSSLRARASASAFSPTSRSPSSWLVETFVTHSSRNASSFSVRSAASPT